MTHGYDAYLDGKPVIVTVAVTGGVHGKEANPNIPETPEEIAAAAAECERAGASIIHMHARRDSGERAFDVDRFQELTDAVRAATDDIVIQHSTGGTAVPLEHRRQPLRTDPPPEMASLDMGPLNRYDSLTSENTRHMVRELHDEMLERGIKPELEAFNNGHLNESFAIWDTLEHPPYVNVIFGGGTTAIPHPRSLMTTVEHLPADAEFNVLGFGPHQLPLTTMGIVLGGHIRVGLEDNLYFARGEPATSNAQLVERAVGIAAALNRPVATPSQARELLGLAGRD